MAGGKNVTKKEKALKALRKSEAAKKGGGKNLTRTELRILEKKSKK